MKKRYWFYLVCLGVLIGYFLMPKQAQRASYLAKEWTDSEQIWIVTDMHYLSPSLHDNGKAFSIIQNTAAGKDVRYSKERMDALVAQVKKEKPKLLLVSGDLSLNGEKKSMEDLAEQFNVMEAAGTEVLVIPGNHDIASGWAREFKGENQVKTAQVTKKDFEKIFTDFGYAQASQRDKSSLSYMAKPFTNLWLLMIDSNIYVDGLGRGAPATNGRLKKETLMWITSQLQEAREAGVQVIPIMHHNVLDQHIAPTSGFTLDNAVDLRELYDQYGITLTFSGHIHTQHITQSTGKQSQLTEVVNGAFSMYPMTIGRLSLKENRLIYQQTRLDVDLWKNNANLDLADHQKYLMDVFHRSSDMMLHTALHDDAAYDRQLADQLSDIMASLNLAFFSGERLTEEWFKEKIYQHPAYVALLKQEPQSRLVDYIGMMIDEMKEGAVDYVEIEWKQKKPD
ncbi:metallophosphoesterase [Streptococcus marmotae]|uniref:metallophosphoesterase n=1 Tax=Streptococcus marmotae TaxID=1825069 RepID=UPI0008353B1F|nr:metallophosphoesterase [Streptococcus marmotae]